MILEYDHEGAAIGLRIVSADDGIPARAVHLIASHGSAYAKCVLVVDGAVFDIWRTEPDAGAGAQPI